MLRLICEYSPQSERSLRKNRIVSVDEMQIGSMTERGKIKEAFIFFLYIFIYFYIFINGRSLLRAKYESQPWENQGSSVRRHHKGWHVKK